MATCATQARLSRPTSFPRKSPTIPCVCRIFFAAIYAVLGIDCTKNLYDGDRPVPITDSGKPIAALFGQGR